MATDLPEKNVSPDVVTPSATAGKQPGWMAIYAVAALITLVTVITFHGLLRNDFLECSDDEAYILSNSHVQQGLSWESVKWAFTTFDASNWHPLTWLSHMLDVELFGMWPGGHHLMSLFLHTAGAILLFVFLSRTTGRLWAGCIAALLFAIHPLNVQSVAWAAERKDVLSALFWFATMLIYTGYVNRGGWARYAAVLLVFAFGLMAKPMLVTLPVVLLLLDYWPLRRFVSTPAWRLIVEKAPLLVLSAASSVVTLAAQTRAIATLGQVDLSIRLANAVRSYGVYLLQVVWPARLAIFYPYPDSAAILRAEAAIAAVVLAAISALACYLWRRKPYLVIGWTWYLITLVPVIGIVQVGLQAHADRYTYIPFVGVFIALVWLVVEAVQKRAVARWVAGAAAVIVIIALCSVTVQAVALWKDSLTLYAHTLNITEHNAMIQRDMACLYLKKGSPDEALAHAQMAVRADPQWFEGYAAVARALMEQGDLEEAMKACLRAVELGRGEPLPHFLLGQIYIRQGDCQMAIPQLQATLALEEDYGVWNDLGVCLKRTGQIEEAERAYRRAIDISPQEVLAYRNLGVLLMERGRSQEAVTELEKAASLAPHDPAIGQLLEQAKAAGR